MNEDLLCSECGAKLELSIDIPIKMNFGKVVIECPTCRNIIPIKFDEQGNIIFIR